MPCKGTATSRRDGEQTAVWEGAERGCYVAWRGLPGARSQQVQEVERFRRNPYNHRFIQNFTDPSSDTI